MASMDETSHVYIYIYIYICVYMYIYVSIHIYVYIYKQVYIYTYMSGPNIIAEGLGTQYWGKGLGTLATHIHMARVSQGPF